MVEKYSVFTLIVLGESLLALLFEGGGLVTLENAHVSKMYVTVAVSVLIIYSFQTLYFNVDNSIAKGGVHAIRAHRYSGIAWNLLHLLYHMALAGPLATGLGLIIRDITLGVKPEAVHAAAAESGGKAIPEAHFDSGGRWLFSAGWGTALLISTIMGLLHRPGPRGQTKYYRLAVRGVVVAIIAIGFPFAEASATTTLIVYSATITLLALSEFILVEADRIGMLSKAPIKSSAQSSEGISIGTDDEDSNDSVEMDPKDDDEVTKNPSDGELGAELGEEELRQEQMRLAAVQRRQRYRRKFEAVFNPNRIHRYCAESH